MLLVSQEHPRKGFSNIQQLHFIAEGKDRTTSRPDVPLPYRAGWMREVSCNCLHLQDAVSHPFRRQVVWKVFLVSTLHPAFTHPTGEIPFIKDGP